MACTQGLFSDSCRAGARELIRNPRIRKQAEGCKLLFTIHTVEEIGINYNWTPLHENLWTLTQGSYQLHVVGQRAYLDPNIWYDAPTLSQLELAQWMALQASLNKDRKSCNQLSCPLSYRTSFHAAFGSQSDMNTDKKEEKKKSCLRTDRNRTLCSICSHSTQSLPFGIGSDIRIVHHPMVCTTSKCIAVPVVNCTCVCGSNVDLCIHVQWNLGN